MKWHVHMLHLAWIRNINKKNFPLLLLPITMLQISLSWNNQKRWLTTATRGEPYIATEAPSPTLPTNTFRWWWSWKTRAEMIAVVQNTMITVVTDTATFICMHPHGIHTSLMHSSTEYMHVLVKDLIYQVYWKNFAVKHEMWNLPSGLYQRTRNIWKWRRTREESPGHWW